MLRFEMSGQRFEFDPAAEKLTAEEFFAVDTILGASMDELLAALADGVSGTRTLRSIIKELCVTAFLAQRRAGGRASWEDFARTIAPATLTLIPDEPPVTVGVSPDLGQQVPDPVPPSFSPTLAALDLQGAHEQPGGPPTGADLYRTP